MSTIGDRALLWLRHDGSLDDALAQVTRVEESIVIEIDAAEALDWDVELGAAILEQPQQLSIALLDRLRNISGVRRRSLQDERDFELSSSRLWIRITAAPVPMAPVENVSGGLVHVFGVAYAVYTVGKTPFMRRFKCRGCGFVHDHRNLNDVDEEVRLPRCCGCGFYEDESAAIYISHQEILLGPSPNVLTGSVINHPLARLHLYDDLTQRINVGDAVSVIGHIYTTSFLPTSLPKSGNLFGEIQINVNNITKSYSATPSSSPDQNPITDPLELLLEQFFGGKQRRNLIGFQNKYQKIAVLLSLASTSSDAKINRRQVHLLFTTTSSSSGITSSLKAAAASAIRSVYHSGDKKQLLASADRHGLNAGSLALSNGGICIVELCKEFLTRDEIKLLRDAIDKETVTLKNCPELAVPCSSTIWGIYATGGNRLDGISKKELLIREVVNKFDIVVPLFDERGLGDDFDDSIAKFIRGDSGGIFPCKERISSISSGIDTVTVTDQAQDLISGYYLMLRRSSVNDDVSLLTLESLLRTASACARLCRRDQVLEVPDATLAIFLCEKTQQAKYESSALEHLSKELASSNSMERKPLDAFLEDFSADLKRLIRCQPRLEE